MANICVITTGGTIGSVLSDGTLAVDDGGSKVACEIQAAANTLGFNVDVIRPVNKNSESFSPTDWLDVLAAIDMACASDVEGVVVLHGTDTMHYTLAAAACFSRSKRVCFTGGMVSPELKNSDAHINLLAAMSFATDGAYNAGVYLAFCDNADRLSARVLHASDVKPLAFDEDSFSSVYNNEVARYSEQHGLQASSCYTKPSYPELGELPSSAELAASQQHVAYIKLYPGIDLRTLQALSEGRSVVVIELYHSGTGPASTDYDDLLCLLEESSDNTLFALSAFPRKIIQYPYASTQALIQAGGHVYADLQPHCLYVLCLLMLAQGKSAGEIKALLQAIRITRVDADCD